jgi:hypothetical protein
MHTEVWGQHDEKWYKSKKNDQIGINNDYHISQPCTLRMDVNAA